jgi:methylated-DNA-[protein]-cysteine S-methyltransferase
MPSDHGHRLTHSSPIGPLTLTGDEAGVRHLYFPGRAPIESDPAMNSAALAVVGEQLGEYFAGDRTTFDLRLAPKGTAFQRRVWELLREIPYGETTTYGQLARQLTDERRKWTEPQAVAGAVARTPIPIIVPCHRVIGADGSLRGYVGGLQRKQKLLDLEASGGDPRALGDTWRDRQLTLV